MTDTSHPVRGWVALLGAIFLFSTIEIASKYLKQQVPTVDSMVLVFVRFAVTGVCLLALGWGKLRRELRLGAKDYGIFLLNGAIGISVGITLFHAAIVMMDKAASAAVVFSINPVFVTLLAPFVNKEKWTVAKVVGVAVGAVGVSFFVCESGAPEMSSLRGLLVMLLSAFCFAASICLSKRVMRRYGPLVLMGFSGLFGALLLVPFIVATVPASAFSDLVPAWRVVAYIAVMGTAMGYGLYYYGIQHTSAQGGSMSFFLKPVIASVLAVIVLKERTNLYMIAGTALILVGLFLAEILPKLRAAARPALVEEPIADV